MQTTSAAIGAQNNFQGLILGGYIYRYTPRLYAPGPCRTLTIYDTTRNVQHWAKILTGTTPPTTTTTTTTTRSCT